MPPVTPTSPAEVVLAINDGATFWDVTRALLLHWRATDPGDSAGHAMNGPPYKAWGDIVHRVRERFEGDRAGDDLTALDRQFLVATSGHGTLPDAVHATAWGLSLATGHTFAPSWRDELGGGRHRLQPGECYPVADAPWTEVFDVPVSSRPASLGIDFHELPTVRVHDGRDFDVSVDFRLERQLEAVITELDGFIMALPNEQHSELALPKSSSREYFPVAPRDAAEQRRRLLEIVTRGVESGRPLIVLPELCVTADDVAAIEAAVADVEDPCLVVAGSHHTTIGGHPENVATGIVAGGRIRMEHHKSTPFSEELGLKPPQKEGIRLRPRPHVVVHQADRFRVALGICKELLDPRLGALYDRMGVNLLLVPAFSGKIEPFVPAAAARVAGAQALTIVVNGPRLGLEGKPLAAECVVGQPLKDRPVVALGVDARAPVFANVRLPFV